MCFISLLLDVLHLAVQHFLIYTVNDFYSAFVLLILWIRLFCEHSLLILDYDKASRFDKIFLWQKCRIVVHFYKMKIS